MTLKELRKIIYEIPHELDSCPVIVQKDPDGSEYSELAVVNSDAVYVKKTRECLKLRWSAFEAGFAESYWEKIKKNNRAIILTPVDAG